MYSKKLNSLLRPTRQASICPHVFFLRQCHSLFMSTSMPTVAYADASARARSCLSLFSCLCPMRAHTSCPYKCTCAMPHACFHADAHAISSICGYVSHRHPLLFVRAIYYIFGYSVSHMNNEWLLINYSYACAYHLAYA